MAKKKKTQSADEKPDTFEAALAELEKIVVALEDGKTGLDEALECYVEGVTLLQNCQSFLEDAERRIQLLSGVDAEGNPIVEPFEEAEADESLEAKSSSRARRRSKTKSKPKRKTARRRSVDEAGRLF